MNQKTTSLIATIVVLLALVFAIVEFSAVPTQQVQIATSTTAAASSSAPVETSTAPRATVVVDGTTYFATIAASKTVLDTMRALASTSNFTFTGKDYPSLGYFIDSIGGKKAADGYNWMLYINGKQSDTGVSQTTVSNGDRIEWKYEK